MTTAIESAYRQIYFHAFKSDRDVNLESQLKNGQITVRDFVRGLCLSDTFKRSFYGMNSNYKVVRHLVEKLLGRKSNKSEEIAWSIVIATKGVEGLVDVLLDSSRVSRRLRLRHGSLQRNRVLPGRDLGDTPFNITSPRYDEYYRGILGFPQIVYAGGPAKKVPARAKRMRGGFPQDYLPGWRKWPMPAAPLPAEVPTWTTCRRFPTAASAADPGLKQCSKKRGFGSAFFVSLTVIPGIDVHPVVSIH